MYTIIVGGGQVGSHVARILTAAGHQISIIETRPEQIDRLVARFKFGPEVLRHGSGTDPDTLEAIGIRKADVVVAVTGEDEVNLVVTNLARFEFGVRRTIARVNNPANAWLFSEQMGVDVALNQADLIAKLIVEEMSLGDMMTLLKLHKGDYSLVEEKVHPDSAAAGRAVHELQLPVECVLTAVIRAGQLIIPRGNTILLPADEVLALCHSTRLQQLAAVLGKSS